MVRFAPHFPQRLLLVREQLSLAHAYDHAESVEAKTASPLPPNDALSPRPRCCPVPDEASATPGEGGASAPSSPVPDPFDDADALEELGDQIATLAAHISSVTRIV